MTVDLDRLLAEGLEHYLNGRLRDAAAAWQDVLRFEPANVRAREYLRSALSAHGPRQGELTPGPRGFAPLAGPERGEATPPLKRRDAPPSVPTRRLELATAGVAVPQLSGWDAGPSAAPSVTVEPEGVDLDLVEHDEGSRPARAGAPDPESDEVANLLRGARELYALNDFSGVLELLELIREQDPNHSGVERMREDCIETLTHMFESQIGALAGVPGLAVNPDEIIWLNLDHRAGFVLAQIDGGVSYDDLYAICGMSRLDTARILAQLLQEKVVKTLR